MSSPANSSAAANAADAGAGMSSNASSTEGASGAMPKKQPEGNPAFRMMGMNISAYFQSMKLEEHDANGSQACHASVYPLAIG